MRAKEFINEQRVPLSADVARAIPGTFTIPELPNSDFYKQYRFGVAIAGARGAEQRKEDGPAYNFSKDTPWGENMIVSSYMDPNIGDTIDYALSEIGLQGKTLISTMDSEEAVDIPKASPIKAFKGYKRK